MKKIIFVTQNKNKISDARKLLSNFDINPIDFEVPEIQSLNSKEIIQAKLKYAYKKITQPCFVMDTSLFLDCLNGFPGPFIKFYFSKTVGAEKTCKIASLFNEKKCQWITTLGYFDGKKEYFFEKKVEGLIPEKPRGTNGYDWDVIFQPIGETRTLAEMSFEEKQKFAVTKQILKDFENHLKKEQA